MSEKKRRKKKLERLQKKADKYDKIAGIVESWAFAPHAHEAVLHRIAEVCWEVPWKTFDEER